MATPRKKPEDRLKVGRPSLYRPEYCEAVIELGKEGRSIAGMAAHFDVGRNTIDEWAAVHPEFSEALTRAKVHAQSWWEQQGVSGMREKTFNARVWEISVRSRFRDDYTERKEVDANVQVTDAPSENLTKLLGLLESARGSKPA
jgi:hypothetical protein